MYNVSVTFLVVKVKRIIFELLYGSTYTLQRLSISLNTNQTFPGYYKMLFLRYTFASSKHFRQTSGIHSLSPITSVDMEFQHPLIR